MDNYITGKAIKQLRENKKITQKELASIIQVSDKTVSKWETSKGLPDISLIEPLAKALNVSIIELMSGNYITNENKVSNISRSKIYVCPVCGNVIHTIGNTVVSCCGINLPELEAEIEDEKHKIEYELIEDEYYISIKHAMTKEHYISFIAYVTLDRFEFVKLYAEGNAEARFPKRHSGTIYVYCNRHGLIKKLIP